MKSYLGKKFFESRPAFVCQASIKVGKSNQKLGLSSEEYETYLSCQIS